MGDATPLVGGAEDNQDRREKERVKPSILAPFRDVSGFGLFLVILGILCSGASGVILPYFFNTIGKTLDSLNATVGADTIIKEMAIAGVACFLLQALACFCLEVMAERITADMRCRYVSSVLSQSMAWYDTHDAASLSSRLDVRLTDVRDGLGMKFVGIPANVMMIVGSIVISLMSSWSVTLCALTGLIPTLLSGALLGWAMRTSSVRVNTALEEAGSVATESFANIRTVAAFGGERAARERYEVLIARAEKAGIMGGIFSGLGFGGLMLSVFGMFALVFYLGGHKVADSWQDLLAQLPDGGEALFARPPSEWPQPSFQAGGAYTISMSLLFASFMLGTLSENFAIYMKAVEAAADIFRAIDEPSAINPSSQDGEKDVPLNGDIVFDSVTFSYPSRPDAIVFKNFSLTIPAGKSVAFVGPSGCGKSTLLQLTQRIYDPAEGTVSIAGNVIIPSSSRLLVYKCVLQRYVLLVCTLLNCAIRGWFVHGPQIEENIRLGCSAPKTMDEVMDVARQAHVAAFVEQLPLKYNTMCGTGGTQLSGGQKQRVALARALLRKPDVLILDEATSALDSKSEKRVQMALDEVIQTSKSTTLIVAHRLSTIQGVDEIIVLDNRGDGAEVVQRGTHDELMRNTQGLYYHLFQSQSGDKDEGEGAQQQKDAPASSANSADEATTTGANPYASSANAVASADDDDLVLRETSHGALSAADMLEAAVGMKAPTLLSRFRKRALHPTKQDTAKLSRAVRMLAPEWLIFLVMVISSLLSGASFPLFGVLVGGFFGSLFQPDVQTLRDKTNFWSLIALIYCLLRGPIEMLKQVCKEFLASRLSWRLRSVAFENLIHQDMSFFDEPANHTGTLVSILSGDVSVLTTAATGNFVAFFHALFSAIGGIVIGFYYSWRLALVLLTTFVLCAAAEGANFKLGRINLNAAGGDAKKKGADSASAIFAEAIQGIRVVMSFGLEEHFGAVYARAATSELGKKARAAIVFGLSWGVSQSMQYFVFCLAMWYGSKLTKEGLASGSDVMNTVFSVMFGASGFGVAVIYSADAKKARSAVVDVFRLIDRKSLIDVRDTSCGSNMLEDFSGAVEYDHVSFRYPLRPEQRVYEDLTFSIAPGESVALVGASGCGKSTAVQLLLRFYDLHTNSKHVSVDGKPTAEGNHGSIRADQSNIQDVHLACLRSLIGLVSQEPVLFNLTIGENIRYSRPDATQAEVEEAARLANAHGFISGLPQGYDTSVGTAGAQLSGGQRQRIAIARALLRNPKILILDEATSALDAESEKQVQATLDRVVAGSTKRSTIIIAHRLSTVKTADKIVVLQNELGRGSRVAEVGTHAQLMNIPNGVYRGLVVSAEKDE
ncbi:hypothetical protein Emag_000668 [Eimeria magna]